MKIHRLVAAIGVLLSSPSHAAKCYVTEYVSLGQAPSSPAQIAREPALLDQTPVDFSAGAAQSATFNPSTSIVRVWCDAQASVVFGSNPTATNTNAPTSAGFPEFHGVTPNSGLKLSVHSNP